MKTCGSGCPAPAFLTSAPDGADWSASRPCRSILAVPNAYEAWWVSRACLGATELRRNEKKNCPAGNRTPGSAARNLVATLPEFSRLHVVYTACYKCLTHITFFFSLNESSPVVNSFLLTSAIRVIMVSGETASLRSACLVLPLLHISPATRNSVASVRERTIPTERPPLVGDVSANFCEKMLPRDQRDGSPTAVISVF
jgi:hypothetical protein